MDRNNLVIILIIIIIILVIIFVCINQFNFLEDNISNKCTNDTDCIDGICHDGQCVECAFDSDCKGSLVCDRGFCTEPEPEPEPEEVIDPPIAAVTNLGFQSTGGILLIPWDAFDIGLEGLIVGAGTFPLDFNSFQVKSLSSYTAVPGTTSVLPSTPPYDGLPYGNNLTPLLAGPGVRTGLNRLEFQGAGAYAGRTFRFEFLVSPTGNGTAIMNEVPPPIAPIGIGFEWVIRMEFCISDTEGNQSNLGEYYFVRIV